jgi:hypothetical protein
MARRSELKGWKVGETVLVDGQKGVIESFPSRRLAAVRFQDGSWDYADLYGMKKVLDEKKGEAE